MSQKLKVVTIGGGSSYTPELIEGIILRHQQIPVTELALVDVEAGREKVAIIAALTQRMLKRHGLEQVKVSVHFGLDEAIRGAQFVLTQLRVGQLAARAAAAERGLVLHVFEEGYLRPFWITYERGGSNGFSALMDISLDHMRAAQREYRRDARDARRDWRRDRRDERRHDRDYRYDRRW